MHAFSLVSEVVITARLGAIRCFAGPSDEAWVIVFAILWRSPGSGCLPLALRLQIHARFYAEQSWRVTP